MDITSFRYEGTTSVDYKRRELQRGDQGLRLAVLLVGGKQWLPRVWLL